MKSKKQFVKQALITLALMVGAISVLSIAPVAYAQLGLDPGINPVASATNNETDLKSMILTVVNYALGFLGLIAVIMIIYGGVTYVTSAGSDEAIKNAKKIIMYALIGLIIILLSFVLVNAVLGAGLGGGSTTSVQ
jgi:hypothetical protein